MTFCLLSVLLNCIETVIEDTRVQSISALQIYIFLAFFFTFQGHFVYFSKTMDARSMQNGKQVANIAPERWKAADYRKKILQSI